MTLVATVASDTANSYLTVAAADALAAADMGPEADLWLAATTDTDAREKALLRATREVDGYLRSGWLRYSATQALLFPRTIDVSGTTPYIPAAIRQATYHQAAYILKNASIIDKANARHARAMSQFSESNLSGSVDDEAVNIISPRAMHYLADYRTARRTGGMGSVRIASGMPPA